MPDGFDVMSDELDGYPATQALVTAVKALPDLIAAATLAMDALLNADSGDPQNESGWASDEIRDAWVALRDALDKAGGGVV